MKVFAVVAVTLVLIVTVSAHEEKKEDFKKFIKCIACSEDPAVRDEYTKCSDLKSEKCKKMAEECKAKIMPDATTSEARWEAICKDDSISEQLCDCVKEHEKELSDGEKTQLKEFLQCAKKINEKFCIQ